MIEKKRVYGWYIAALVVGLVVVALIGVSVGSASITWFDSIRLLLSKVPVLSSFVNVSDISSVYETIIFQVRMPRVLLAALVGCGLSTVGCAFQAVFRNPLADPHILGVSSGAALGATIAMLSGISFQFLGMGVIGLFAFAGGLITVFAVYHLASLGGRMVTTSILLTGTAMSTLLSSLMSLLMTYHSEELEKVYMWTLGSFASASWTKVQFLLLFTVVGIVAMMVLTRELNVILTGEESAESLGIDTGKVRVILIVLGTVIAAGCVAVSGIIGFVGLIIPHSMRLLVGSDHKILLPVSCMGGAIFMIVCDSIARTIAAPTELPVGVITAIFGAPYFIFLLYRENRKGRGR